jgi:RHS repeat-associated protein
VTLAESYEPYGSVLVSTGTASSIFGYAGEQIDTTGLVYLRARYMNPRLGIFLARDPWSGDVMQPGSMNGFNYVDGNPVSRIDPSGWDWLKPEPWEGTYIHRLIGLHFKNIWGAGNGFQAEYNFRVEGASKNCTGNFGRPDLLDFTNREVYEIKHYTCAQQAVNEAMWYIPFLNLDPRTRPNLQAGQVPWTLGTLYLNGVAEWLGPWPKDPDHEVRATQSAPGAIIYWGELSRQRQRELEPIYIWAWLAKMCEILAEGRAEWSQVLKPAPASNDPTAVTITELKAYAHDPLQDFFNRLFGTR